MKLISLYDDKKKMSYAQKVEFMSKPVEILAVLSKAQYQMVRSGGADIEIPNGTEMINAAGSRELNFYCENREIAEDLMDGLDASGIDWYESEDVDQIPIEDEQLGGGRSLLNFPNG